MKSLFQSKKAIILTFLISLMIICVIRLSDILNGDPSSKKHKRLLSSSSSGQSACSYIDNDINDGTVVTKGTSDAFAYLAGVRPVNKLLTPLKSGSTSDWNSYEVSLLPVILPFFIVSIFCFIIWVTCASQIVFKSCCRCCDRDLYRNPYSKRSIFWCMIASMILFILCTMTATVSIIQLEYTFQGYQQLHCQGYQLFDHFINGNASVNNWIGINSISSNIVTVQNTIATNIDGFKNLFTSGQSSGTSTDTQKSALYTYITQIFQEFRSVQITNPSPTTSNPSLNLDSYIKLEVQGFDNITNKMLADYNTVIVNISSLLDTLSLTAQNLDTNASANTSFINTTKTQIDQFTTLMQSAQTNVNNLFEKGYNYFFWCRVILLIFLGLVLFCCISTFIMFFLMYFQKVKCLEHVVNFTWSITALVAIAGFLMSGIFYTTTIVFYEGSLSLNYFLTNSSNYSSLSYLLDPDAAQYTSDCVFDSTATLINTFGLTTYLTTVNNISKYISLNQAAFGGLEYPNISIKDMIQDCNNYLSNIGSLAPSESSAKLAVLNNCFYKNSCVCDTSNPSTVVKCSQQIVEDLFVFNGLQCSADGVKRFILSQGQENSDPTLQSCIFIAIDTLNADGSTYISKNLDYTLRLNDVASGDTSSGCTTLKSCGKDHRSLLIKYASESGKQISAIKAKLQTAQTNFINLYQNYYSLFTSLLAYYNSKLEKSVLLVSDSSTGMFTNLQCTEFGNDLKQLNRYLENQFIFDLYSLGWWTISTFVGMILGLFFMYFAISRLQFWANLEGELYDQAIHSRVSQDKPFLPGNVSQNKINTPINNNNNINNMSILNESQLKSQLINQSAYNKKYVSNRANTSQQSTNNFQYQVSLTDISQFESPAKNGITNSQLQPQYTKSQYELEMENYHS